MAKKKVQEKEIDVVEINEGVIDVCIVGDSPLVYNSLSTKALSELIFPRGKLTAQEKKFKLKHDVLAEYQNSVYRYQDDDVNETYCYLPAVMFKRSMSQVAIDLAESGSVTKAQVGRLTHVSGLESVDKANLYGVPQLLISGVVQAGISRTPDARVRAIVPEWACQIRVRHMLPMIKEGVALRLLAAAGQICGVGDGRPQKGAMSYGRFRMVAPDDPNFVRIVNAGTRDAQLAALTTETPQCYDDQTAELFTYYQSELRRREMKEAG